MKFKIPFTFSSLDKSVKQARPFKGLVKPKKDSKLEEYLNQSDTGILREDYLAIAIKNAFTIFFLSTVIITTLLAFVRITNFVLIGISAGVLFSCFIFATQISYPKLYAVRREKEIERNLIPALEDILVQLNSGIPLFNIMVNISLGDYGSLSEEFKKIVKKINAGESQIQILDEFGEKNSSIFFRRTLWQISNGMKSGSDMSSVIRDSIKALNEEQLIQIQNYGNKLNPIIMFYMLIAVILPALSITFLTIISSLINLTELASMLMYITLFVFVIIIQFMFLGVIRSLRPSLL